MAESFQSFEQLLLDPELPMSKQSARFFSAITFDEKVMERMQLLSEKANEGQLTEAENSELLEYVTLGDVVAVLKMRAELLLGKQDSAA